MAYNVVFKTKGGPSDGAITWSSYQDEAEFNRRYSTKMRAWYRVVEKGVSQERVIELCSTPEATWAAVLSMIREKFET